MTYYLKLNATYFLDKRNSKNHIITYYNGRVLSRDLSIYLSIYIYVWLIVYVSDFGRVLQNSANYDRFEISRVNEESRTENWKKEWNLLLCVVIRRKECQQDEIVEDTICHEAAEIPYELQHESSSSFQLEGVRILSCVCLYVFRR